MTALALPELAAAIEREHHAAIGAARSAIDHALECGRLLRDAKSSVPHGEWLPWIEANLSFGARQAQKYLRLADQQKRLPNSHLASIDDALAAIAEPNGSHALHVMCSSAEDDYWTPPHILDRVVATLGEIDCDPCWHPECHVTAHATYTAADDGLSQPWGGRVFMNPPWSGSKAAAWVEKAVAEHASGRVTEAILLVPARVDTEWFHLLDPHPRCFVRGRLVFGNGAYTAPFPSALVYLGAAVARFAQVFGAIGGIWIRLDGAAP